jgi:hypothetical protein
MMSLPVGEIWTQSYTSDDESARVAPRWIGGVVLVGVHLWNERIRWI